MDQSLTVQRGTFTKEKQHAVMAKLTDTLMYWEKVPDTHEARKVMKGWVYEVDEDSDYNDGGPHHKDPFVMSRRRDRPTTEAEIGRNATQRTSKML